MAVSLTTLAAEILADAAAIATEIGGGRTTAEIQALSRFLGILAVRRDISQQALRLQTLADGAALNNG
jgi:hypothetical protein